MILPLTIQDVSFEIGGIRLIKDLNCTLEAGPRTMILGANGAGKSLFLRLCHGLIRPTTGRVLWQGAKGRDPADAQAMVFQRPVMLRRSVAANVDYALKLRGMAAAERRAAVEDALGHTGLRRLADNPARVLSVGEQQKLALARAWALQPEVLFLDEPTAGVDVELRKDMWHQIDMMRARGVTVILTTHYIEEAEEMADRVGIIRGGKILMVDQKDAMMARLGRTEAHVMLAQPLDALPPAIASFPVELEEGGRSICYRGGDGTGKGREEVADLTKALIASGIDYVGIDVRESSLEDIFVSLLGEEEEQAA